jgi:ABC-type uncharacterized transport system auxiliary subunit
VKYFWYCCLFCLAACSITSPRDVGNANRLTLAAPEPVVAAGHKRGGGLKVDYPSTSSDLNTYRIAVSKHDGKRDYFSGARWDEFLPSVMQSALIETFIGSKQFSFVVSDEENTPHRYVLHTVIEECRAVYESAASSPVIVMRVTFHISTAPDKKKLRTFTLEKHAQSKNNTLASIAQAFNQAFSELAGEAVEKVATIK